MSSDRIAVTGSTGRIGGRVAHGLAERGIPLRLSVRDADRAPQLPDSEVVEGSYSESETLLDVFDNIDTVFFVSAPESVDFIRQHDIFLGSALSAGVRNVVYLSYYGAMRDATCSTARAHWHTEQILRDRGARWTFLRDNVYADQLPLMVGSDDVIHAPVKKGRVAAVDPDDVVEVAIEVLTDPARHNHMAYELTGPESLSFARIAELLSEASGHHITFENQSVSDAYSSRAGTAEPWQVEALVSSYVAIAKGEMGDVTHDVERVLGRPATPAIEVLRRHYAAQATVG